MKRMILALAAVLALAASASADVCVPTTCADGTTGTICCPAADPANIPPPSPEVATCGTIDVDETTYIAGCIGSSAGANNIAGCISVGGAVTSNDVLGEDGAACAADAVAACEACGCAVNSCDP